MPTRKAILISCPGLGRKYLVGANKDIKNMYNFLTSPRGGAWRKEEIICLYNPAWFQAKREIDKHLVDYQFIYFAGHGSGGENQRRYLAFNDGEVEDIDLLNINPKQLIVADACRVYYPTISGIPPAEDSYSSFTGVSDARKVFDDCITQSRNGKMIVHATQHGVEAMEERYLRGGAFTLSLLHSALNFNTGMNLCPVLISDLLPIVCNTLSSQNYDQIPEIAYESGELRVPFLIDTEQMNAEEPAQEEYISERKPKPSILQILAVFALGIVIIRGLRN